MKKLFLFIMLFVFSFFIACTQQNIIEKQYVCADGKVVNNSQECFVKNLDVVEYKETEIQIIEQKQDIEQKPEISEEEITKGYTFSLEEVRNLDKKLIGKRAVLLSDTMQQPIWINDNYIFKYAMQSDLVKPSQFRLHIKFLEARTMSNSKIGADDLTEKWFLGVEGIEFNLSKGEKKYIPLTFKVWDIVNKDGLKTFEGTYIFDVVLYSKNLEDDGNFNDVYTSNRFYVRIGK